MGYQLQGSRPLFTITAACDAVRQLRHADRRSGRHTYGGDDEHDEEGVEDGNDGGGQRRDDQPQSSHPPEKPQHLSACAEQVTNAPTRNPCPNAGFDRALS
eukprot:3933828-Rhodomonas_salina.6